MSKIRFELAKQYIQERDYDKAREILGTMPDNPTAQKWRAKLDEIDPPFPDVAPDPFAGRAPVKEKRMLSSRERNAALEQEVQQAQKGGRISGGILSVLGAGLILFMLIANPLIRTRTSTYRSVTMSYPPTSFDYIMTALIVGLGIFFIGLGIYQFWYAGRTDKIRETLAKGKAKNIKRAGFMFLGVAIVWAFTAVITKQTSNLGTSMIWAIAGGIMLLYQLPKAEEFDRQQGLSQDGEKPKRSQW